MNWKETKCGKCKIQRRKPICNSCSNHNRFVPMTNADHIRSMSDEELAEFLCNVNQYSDMQVPSKEEINVMLDWLRSEVEEVNNPEPCEPAQSSWKDQMLRKFLGRRK